MRTRENTRKIKWTPAQAAQKIRPYCAYQERSQQEVMDRLREHGITGAEAEEILASLIEENYLNEQRFAQQYAGGKFRMKGWGRVRIRLALRARGVGDYCIRKALEEIDETDYLNAFEEQAKKKWQSLRGEKNLFTKKRKLRDYLLQRGFEQELISGYLNNPDKNG